MHRLWFVPTLALALFALSASPARTEWIQDGGSALGDGVISGSDLSLALDQQGKPVVAWIEYLGHDISLSHWNGLEWTRENVVSNPDHGVWYIEPALAISPAGPYLANTTWSFHGQQGAELRHFNGADWSTMGEFAGMNHGHSPGLAVSPQSVCMAYLDDVYFDFTGYHLYVKRCSGADWEQLGGNLFLHNGQNTERPSVVMDGDTVYVAWSESNTPAAHVAYVKQYRDGAWSVLGGSVNIDPAQDARQPSLALAGHTLFLVWIENQNVRAAYWNAQTGHWITDGGYPNPNSQKAAWPKMILANGVPYVTWLENNGTANQVMVKHFDGVSWVTDSESLNVDPLQSAGRPDLATDGTNLFVSWVENEQIYMKHLVLISGSPSATATETALGTQTPSRTATPMPTQTATPSPSPTATPVLSGTPTATETQAANESPTLTPSAIATATLTAAPTDGLTAIPTCSSTCTAVCSPSPTATVTAQSTPPSPAFPDPRVFHGKPALAYPNPARGAVHFAWTEAGVESVRVMVYNLNGERLTTLRAASPGQTLRWETGSVAPGIYFYQIVITSGGREQFLPAQKLAIIKD